MKKVQNILAVVAMTCIVLAVFLTSFQVAVYGDQEYRFYEKMYEKYHVTDDLNMKLENVMDVTEYMMAYLIGEEEELSIVTDVDGREQDFFNEQDRLHMADVRGLFLGGLRLRNMLVVAAVILIVILALLKTELWKLLGKAYMRALLVFVGCALLLAVGCAIDFTACFTLFHKLFFTNDLWLFDPATDYMIRMLPEGFFLSMAVRIGIFFLIGLLLPALLLAGWKKIRSEKGKNERMRKNETDSLGE